MQYFATAEECMYTIVKLSNQYPLNKTKIVALVNLVRLTLFFLYQWQYLHLKTYSETLVLNNNITEYWFPKKPGLEHLFCDIWFYLPLIILNYRAKRSRPDRQYMPGSSIMTLYCSVERQYRYIY